MRRAAGLLAGLLALGLAVWAVGRIAGGIEPGELLRFRPDPAGTVLIVIGTAAVLLLPAVRYLVYLPGTPARPIFHAVTGSTALSYLLPLNLGAPIRALLLTRSAGVDLARSSALAVYDLALGIGLAGAIGMAGGALLWEGGGMVILALAAAGVAGVAGVWTMLRPGAPGRPFHRSRLRLREVAGQAVRTVTGIGPGRQAALVVLTGAGLTGNAAVVLGGLAWYGASVDPLVLLTALCAAEVAGTLSPVPLGLGVKEGTLALALAAAGVGPAPAAAAPVVARLVISLTGLAAGGWSLWAIGFRPGRDRLGR